MNNKKLLGSETAKGGFRNEEEIINKFNNWKNEKIAQDWLVKMGYVIKEIEFVKAIKISGNYKTDVQVQVTIKLKEAIDCENLSIKFPLPQPISKTLPFLKFGDIKLFALSALFFAKKPSNKPFPLVNLFIINL